MAVLAINLGSSSLKFALVDARRGQRALLRGSVSDIGSARASFSSDGGHFQRPVARGGEMPALSDVAEAVTWLAGYLRSTHAAPISSVGHRVVHGGARFTAATLVDDAFLRELDDLASLAPLHNPASHRAILAARDAFPDLPHVAVFDTAFHATLPDYAYSYALPDGVRSDAGVRRFGFHGTSHRYLARRSAELLDRPLEELRLITLHLGSGSSAAATQGGRSIDTSMGFTPLEGLMMGTRSGDVDASVPLYLQRHGDLSADDVEHMLNERSGLLGVAGVSDMREVERRMRTGDAASKLAFDMFCYRTKKYLGAYLAALGGADMIVFSGGIGEHSAAVRAEICRNLSALGIEIDPSRNAEATPDAFLQTATSPTAIALVATDEESQIARETLEVLGEAVAD